MRARFDEAPPPLDQARVNLSCISVLYWDASKTGGAARLRRRYARFWEASSRAEKRHGIKRFEEQDGP
jgi:hypothetical protein